MVHDASLKGPYWLPIKKIASYAITGQDTLGAFHNSGATGAIVLTLPKALATNTLEFKVLVATAQTITVTPKIATDTIRGHAAGASVSNAVVGSFIKLSCIQDGFWEIEINVGAW